MEFLLAMESYLIMRVLKEEKLLLLENNSGSYQNFFRLGKMYLPWKLRCQKRLGSCKRFREDAVANASTK